VTGAGSPGWCSCSLSISVSIERAIEAGVAAIAG
jgi:hypothetical protein